MSTTEKSYYEILGVSKNVETSELKGVYRKLVLKYHPDKLPDDKKEWGESMIKEINEAYSIVSDPKKRDIYDKFGKDGLEGMAGPGGNPSNMPDLSDFMNDIFRGGDPFGNFGGQRREKVPPVECYENITLEEVYTGKSVEKEIDRYNLCTKCDGTGSADKKDHKCKTCNGKGSQVFQIQLGPNMIQQGRRPCQMCNGSGNSVDYQKCTDCNGKKIEIGKYTLKFKIEPGVKHHDTVIIDGKGHEILPESRGSGNKRGDVVVVINELEHATFKRGVVIEDHMDPANLSMTMEINLAEALCGFSRSINHFGKNKLFVTSINIVKDGDIKFIADAGLPYKNKNKNKKGKFGKLFVKFKINYPTEISHDNKKTLYNILTEESLDDVDNTIPPNHTFKHMNNLDNLDTNDNNYHSDSSDYDSNDSGVRGPVQCAQQ
jgi:DnaJ-class molecular chaperone